MASRGRRKGVGSQAHVLNPQTEFQTFHVRKLKISSSLKQSSHHFIIISEQSQALVVFYSSTSDGLLFNTPWKMQY